MCIGQWIEEGKAGIQRMSGEVVISLPSFSRGCRDAWCPMFLFWGSPHLS